MIVTRQIVAQKLGAYLRHGLTLAELVDWAEEAMREGELDASGFSEIRDAIARLGLADVRAFGLSWDDCEGLLRRLGYAAHVEIQAVGF
jgi:hypothetical protein